MTMPSRPPAILHALVLILIAISSPSSSFAFFSSPPIIAIQPVALSSSHARVLVALNVARGDRFARTIGGGGSSSTKGKVHIQLLETIPSIGQKGDITYVSPAVYQNQLKKGNKARLITDEEIQRIEADKSEADRLLLEAATRTKIELEEAMVDNLREDSQCSAESSICGVALEMKRRAGPEGNLFGGVTPRMILDGLKERYPNGSWDGKLVKVTTVRDAESGKEVKTKDIKRIGDYTVTVMLWKEIDVTFILSIIAE